jgi:hypothetical protein
LHQKITTRHENDKCDELIRTVLVVREKAIGKTSYGGTPQEDVRKQEDEAKRRIDQKRSSRYIQSSPPSQ